jgi:predicted metal-binding protein
MHIIFEKNINVSSIKISPRSIIKCTNCPQYDKNPSCPPKAPDYILARKWLYSYAKALLIKCFIDNNFFETQKREMLKMLLDREKFYFSQNKLYAYALFPGNCNLCETCSYYDKKVCLKPTLVRYSLDAVGIEISSIVDIDFSESVLYGLILIE